MHWGDNAADDGLLHGENSRDSMADLARILNQGQAEHEAEQIEFKRVQLTARVMLFSMQSGKSVSECERLDITEAQLQKMACDAKRLELLTLKLQCIESCLQRCHKPRPPWPQSQLLTHRDRKQSSRQDHKPRQDHKHHKPRQDRKPSSRQNHKPRSVDKWPKMDLQQAKLEIEKPKLQRE